MGRQLTAGVVGLGWAAEEFHLPVYQENTETKLVAIADIDTERLRTVADSFGIPNRYSSAHSMLVETDLDLVSICTPPSTHEEIFIEAATNNCHIFCEKPAATDAGSAQRMQDAAKEAEIITQIGHTPRYYENYQRVLNMIDTGLLADIESVTTMYIDDPPGIDWYYDPDVAGGGVIRDRCPHIFDMYLDMFDAAPTVTGCRTRSKAHSPVEKRAAIELAFGDTPVDITVEWDQNSLSRTTILGTNGWVEVNHVRLEGCISGTDFEFKRGSLPVVDLEVEKLFGSRFEDPHRTRIHDFIDHVTRGDSDTQVPILKAVTITQLIDDIYQFEEKQ